MLPYIAYMDPMGDILWLWTNPIFHGLFMLIVSDYPIKSNISNFDYSVDDGLFILIIW
jgi:hypothetical protein